MDHLRAGQRQSWDPWADDLEAGQRKSETLDGQLGHWTRPKGQSNPSGPPGMHCMAGSHDRRPAVHRQLVESGTSAARSLESA